MTDVEINDVATFEQMFRNLEQICIFVRAPRHTEVKFYRWTRQASDRLTLEDLIRNRIRPCLGNLEFEVLDGHCEISHKRQTLRDIRNSYNRK